MEFTHSADFLISFFNVFDFNGVSIYFRITFEVYVCVRVCVCTRGYTLESIITFYGGVIKETLENSMKLK